MWEHGGPQCWPGTRPGSVPLCSFQLSARAAPRSRVVEGGTALDAGPGETCAAGLYHVLGHGHLGVAGSKVWETRAAPPRPPLVA